MPGVKIILLVRNPIDRTWSQLRRWLHRRRNGEIDPSLDLLDNLKRIVGRRGVALRGDYVRAINNWGNYFPKEQFFIGFFDDIVQNPKQFLLRTFDFLGVEPLEKHITELAYRTANPSPEREIPPEFALYLTEKYYPQIEALSEMLGGHADQWRRQAEKLLGEAGRL